MKEKLTYQKTTDLEVNCYLLLLKSEQSTPFIFVTWTNVFETVLYRVSCWSHCYIKAPCCSALSNMTNTCCTFSLTLGGKIRTHGEIDFLLLLHTQLRIYLSREKEKEMHLTRRAEGGIIGGP